MFFWAISYPENRTIKNITCICGFSILVLLHTFVNPNYSDLHEYCNAFETVDSLSWDFVAFNNIPGLKAEYGYRLFSKFISTITSYNFVFLFIVSIVMLSGYFYTTKRYSSMVALSVLLIITGPYMQSLFVLRQHIAMGIVLFTYPLIIDRKLITFIIVMLIAISFHQTAAIFLPIYFIYGIKKDRNLIITIIIAFLVLYTCLAIFLSIYANNLALGTAQYDDSYLETTENGGTNAKMAILMMGLLCFRIAILKKEFFKKDITRLLSIILCFGTIFSIAGIGFIGSSRMNMYYTATTFLVLPNTLMYLKSHIYQIFWGVLYWGMTFLVFMKNSNELISDGLWFFFPS